MTRDKIAYADYFPALVAMANRDNEIDCSLSGGKPLELFLAQRFHLSKPTVNGLLSTWENEGWIATEKDALRGVIRKIKIVNLSLQQKEKAKIFVFLDWSNITINTDFLSPGFSLIAGLDRIQRQMVEDTDGEIVMAVVFAPRHLTSAEEEAFHKQGFYVTTCVISCPTIKTKTGGEKDTTDETLIEFLKDIIGLMPSLTHICVGSGDKDFCLALRRALRKGLKLMIMAGNLTSLSADVIDLADTNPRNGRKMVYIFSPTKE